MDEESITAFPLDGTVESQPNMSETVQLDPEGDAVLSIKGSGGKKSYLVSSRVLSLASPVFSKMFGPNFKEGIQTRRGDRPCISLGEDDPKAMGLILGILHYKCSQVPFDMEPAEIAALAVHCDKYDCNEPLRPWAAHWCSKLKDVTAPEDLGFMLLAAYMFCSPSFSEGVARAVRQLTPDFASVWGKYEALALLPEAITASLSDRITDGLKRLNEELHGTEVRLRIPKDHYTMPSFVCLKCHENFSGNVERCYSCQTNLARKTCTGDYRVAEYFAILNRCGLWPSVEPFTTKNLSDILRCIKLVRTNHNHQCQKGKGCPLILELNELSRRAQRLVDNIHVIINPFN